jgi:hypothetical protein
VNLWPTHCVAHGGGHICQVGRVDTHIPVVSDWSTAIEPRLFIGQLATAARSLGVTWSKNMNVWVETRPTSTIVVLSSGVKGRVIHARSGGLTADIGADGCNVYQLYMSTCCQCWEKECTVCGLTISAILGCCDLQSRRHAQLGVVCILHCILLYY